MKPIIKKIVAWLSLVVVVLYVITGYGITKAETMAKISFGLLTRDVSKAIHFNLLIPLIILVLAHLVLALDLINKFKREKELNNL